MSWQSGFSTGPRTQSRSDMVRRGRTGQKRYTFGTHAQTCHVWAQQQPGTHIGQSSDGRIRFEGATIFSYGNHFPIARFVGEYKSRRVVLFSKASYSISTSQHKHHVRSTLKDTDIIIEAFDLRQFHSDPSREQIEAGQVAILESLAEDSRLENEAREKGIWRQWDQKRVEESSHALDAYRAIFKPRSKLPVDVVAWSDARKAKAAKKELRRKLKDARELAKRIAGAQLQAKFQAPEPNADSYTIEHRIRSLKNEASTIYSARMVLATGKASRKLIATCSQVLKQFKLASTKWQAALPEAQYRERRESDLADINELRDYLSGKNGDPCRPRALGHVEIAARLWSVAIRENIPDMAKALSREVQAMMWQREMQKTFKPYSLDRERITVDDWRNGKGNGYQYHFPRVEVRRKGNKLETSKGAECPWRHAVAAFNAVQACRINIKSWRANGEAIRVGHFHVDNIDPDGTLHAGCHVIGYDAMQRLAILEIPEAVKPTYPVPALAS